MPKKSNLKRIKSVLKGGASQETQRLQKLIGLVLDSCFTKFNNEYIINERTLDQYILKNSKGHSLIPQNELSYIYNIGVFDLLEEALLKYKTFYEVVTTKFLFGKNLIEYLVIEKLNIIRNKISSNPVLKEKYDHLLFAIDLMNDYGDCSINILRRTENDRIIKEKIVNFLQDALLKAYNAKKKSIHMGGLILKRQNSLADIDTSAIWYKKLKYPTLIASIITIISEVASNVVNQEFINIISIYKYIFGIPYISELCEKNIEIISELFYDNIFEPKLIRILPVAEFLYFLRKENGHIKNVYVLDKNPQFMIQAYNHAAPTGKKSTINDLSLGLNALAIQLTGGNLLGLKRDAEILKVAVDILKHKYGS